MTEFYALAKSLWLLWCVLLFAAIVAWVLWPSRKGRLEAQGRIPFEDDKER